MSLVGHMTNSRMGDKAQRTKPPMMQEKQAKLVNLFAWRLCPISLLLLNVDVQNPFILAEQPRTNVD